MNGMACRAFTFRCCPYFLNYTLCNYSVVVVIVMVMVMDN